MDASPFSVILAGLIYRLPGAIAACLVDRDGESVDYAGAGDPFDIKVAGAYWQIVERMFNETLRFSGVREIVVRCERGAFLLRALPDKYVVVIMLHRRAGFAGADRAISACVHALAREARWDLPETRSWFAIHVESDERRRPIRIIYGGLAERVEVVGTVAGGLRRAERGFRIRLASGPEITVVREPGDFWYAEEYHGA